MQFSFLTCCRLRLSLCMQQAAHLISCKGNFADNVLCWVVAMLQQDLLHRQTIFVPAFQQVGGEQQTAGQSPAAKKRSLESAIQQQR